MAVALASTGPQHDRERDARHDLLPSITILQAHATMVFAGSRMVRVFIGYDSKAPVLYNVLQHSIQKRSSVPVHITPIMLSQLRGIYQRSPEPLAATEFSFSRFLVPYLSNYQGWSLFIDNDMLMLDDIAKLWALRDDRYSVMCTKHRHIATGNKKFLGKSQTSYEKKNWSSCVLFNNSRCKALTPEYVNSANGLELHQFKWLETERQIGDIPLRWNYLADVRDCEGDISMIHYTLGGPCYDEYRECEHASLWLREFEDMTRCTQLTDMLTVNRRGSPY